MSSPGEAIDRRPFAPSFCSLWHNSGHLGTFWAEFRPNLAGRATNHAGPYLLTSLLLPLLAESADPSGDRASRIVTVASRLEKQGQCDPEFLVAQNGQTRPLDPKKGYDPMGVYCDTKLW